MSSEYDNGTTIKRRALPHGHARAQPHRPRQRRGRGAHAARGVEAAEDRDPLRDLLDGEDIADRRLRRRGLPVRNLGLI